MNPAVTLEEADYEFSQVPEIDLESCLYYEYMRESEAIRDQVSKLSSRMQKQVKRLKLKIGDKIEFKNLN